MGSTTRKASKAPRKRLPSIKSKENAQQKAKVSKKRVQRKQLKQPSPAESIIQLDPDSVPEIVPVRSIDVSNHQYTLSMHCMLGTDEFNNDTELLKLGEWDWRQWNTQCIRKLHKAADEGGFDTEWITGHATIKARGVIKADMLGFDVEDDNGWKKVERFIELWMKAGKRDIFVNLTSTWKKKGGSSSLDDNQDPGGIRKRMVL